MIKVIKNEEEIPKFSRNFFSSDLQSLSLMFRNRVASLILIFAIVLIAFFHISFLIISRVYQFQKLREQSAEEARSKYSKP